MWPSEKESFSLYIIVIVKAKREDEIKAAHDEAMFGVSSVPPSADTDSDVEGDNNKLPSTETAPVTNFISNQVREI